MLLPDLPRPPWSTHLSQSGHSPDVLTKVLSCCLVPSEPRVLGSSCFRHPALGCCGQATPSPQGGVSSCKAVLMASASQLQPLRDVGGERKGACAATGFLRMLPRNRESSSLALGERLVVGGLGWLHIWGPAWEAGPSLLGFKGLPLLPSAEAAFLLGAGTCPRVCAGALAPKWTENKRTEDWRVPAAGRQAGQEDSGVPPPGV